MGCAILPVRTAPAAQPRPPVLLVHGIGDSAFALNPLRDHLLAAGWTEVEAINLKPNDGSSGLPQLAEQVRDAALRLKARTGSDKVDVVGFSMGALVTRYWLMRLDGRAVVRRFISISGPHHGTALAFVRLNAGIAQMCPGSPFLADLETDEGDWGGVEVVSFWTPFDLMIIPARSGVLAGSSVERAFPVLAHPLMLYDGRVLDAVADSLLGRPSEVLPPWHFPDWP